MVTWPPVSCRTSAEQRTCLDVGKVMCVCMLVFEFLCVDWGRKLQSSWHSLHFSNVLIMLLSIHQLPADKHRWRGYRVFSLFVWAHVHAKGWHCKPSSKEVLTSEPRWPLLDPTSTPQPQCTQATWPDSHPEYHSNNTPTLPQTQTHTHTHTSVYRVYWPHDHPLIVQLASLSPPDLWITPSSTLSETEGAGL